MKFRMYYHGDLSPNPAKHRASRKDMAEIRRIRRRERRLRQSAHPKQPGRPGYWDRSSRHDETGTLDGGDEG